MRRLSCDRSLLGSSGRRLAPRLALSANAGTLDQVKARGQLICGANPGLAGFGLPDDQGVYKGLDVNKFQGDRRSDLQRSEQGQIPADQRQGPSHDPGFGRDRRPDPQHHLDPVARQTAGMFFTGINFYDGQGFMVRKKLGIDSALKLNSSLGLSATGDDHRTQSRRLFPRQQHEAGSGGVRDRRPGEKAYNSGRCDAYTTDASGLYSERLKMSYPDDNIVLPEIISKEPLGPSVRKDDIQWFQIVQWTHYALLTAEELGVTKANVDEKLKSDNPAIRRLLGVEGSFGEGLGLTNDWAYRIIKARRQLRRDRSSATSAWARRSRSAAA